MRAPSILARLVLLGVLAGAACVGAVDSGAELDDGADGPSAGAPGCQVDADCVALGTTCCACPTFAVPVSDPVARACSNVTGKPDCPPAGCPDLIARCGEDRRCELACRPQACTMNQSCAYGFATDMNGCLTCDCAAPAPGGCTTDAECVQTRADCCGCKRGGFDTAVLATERAKYDAMLMCPPSPTCPGVDRCTTDEPTCVQGRCELVSRDLPAGACGRPDLPACPAGLACVVNLSDQANMHGVGVCAEPP